MSAGVRAGLALLGAAAVFALFALRAAPFADFRFDDVYISLRYARNLVEHGKLSFNVDDRVDGYTSPGWTVLLAGVMAAGADGESAAIHLGRACGAAAVAAAVVLARALGAPWPIALAVVVAGSLGTPGYLVWASPGMETPYAALTAVLALLAFLWRPAGGRTGAARPWLFAAAAFACATARPEGALLAVGLAVADGWRVGRAARGPERRRALAPHLALAGTGLLLFATHWVYYGAPLPNAYYAKQSAGTLVERGVRDLRAFLSASHLWLAPLAGVALAARPRAAARERLAALTFAVWSVATCAVYARAGGDHMGFHRFYQPLVPAAFAVLAAAVGLPFPRDPRGLRLAGAAAVALVAGAYLWTARADEIASAWPEDAHELASSSQRLEQWRRAARALRRRYPPGTSLAIRAAGVIPYETGFPTYDTLGLNNPEVAHRDELRGDVPGHQKQATPVEIVSWAPDLIVHHPVIEESDRSGRPRRWVDRVQYREAGYTYRCLRSAPREWLCYWERPGVREQPAPPHTGATR